jgi:dihydrofolate reductase
MSRPDCCAFVGASLDGFIARRDGAIDWLRPYEGAERGFTAFFASVDALVVGRATYDTVLAFDAWPYGRKRVYVLTHRPPTPLHGETFLSGEPGEVASRLAGDGVRRAYVDGGEVVSRFLAAGLLDELTLNLIPVVLGDGIRLFRVPLPERALRLDGTTAFPDGLVQLRYRIAP